MKKILLTIILLLSFTVAIAEIQIDSGKNEFRIYERGASADLYFSVHTDNVRMGDANTGIDLKVFGATAGCYWLWDESANGVVQQGTLTIGKDDTGYDVKLFGATASSYKLWDESADMEIYEGADSKFNDTDYLLFGDATAGDAQQSWNGTYLELAPVTGFWANCPNLAYPDPTGFFQYFEDFIGHVNFAAAAGAAGGWKSAGDATYDVLNAAGTIGGIIQLSAETASNNEVYHQLGTLGTETYIEYVKDSGDKSWVEFRVAASSITGAANWFVGLAEEGAAAADFIVDTGDSTSNVDMVGFVVWEGDPNAIDCNHQKAGGDFVDAGLSGVPVANTYVTLGLYFDGAETVSWYHNGTAVQTADLDTATFPTGEELSPIIGIKQGAADVTLSVDWIRIVAER